MKPVLPEQLLADVGRRLAEIRSERGLTQEALAEAVGVTSRWIQSAEAGGENLRLTSLLRFANALNVTVAELFVVPKRTKPRPGRPRRGAS